MKTQQEIIDRFNERKQNDFFGFEVGEYVNCLDYEHAKSLDIVKEEVTKDQWEKDANKYTRESLLERMKDYMEFAWDKANNCRGISANRSIMHYIAWIWLLGDDEFSAKVEQEFEDNYEHYGKEILEMICEYYGWDWKQWDNGVRTNYEE